MSIYNNTTYIQNFIGLKGFLEIFCKDPCLKTVYRIVHSFEGLFKVFVGGDNNYWREGFLGGYAKLRFNILQDCRFEDISFS